MLAMASNAIVSSAPRWIQQTPRLGLRCNAAAAASIPKFRALGLYRSDQCQNQNAVRVLVCRAGNRNSSPLDEDGFISNGTLQLVLWSMTGVYVVWMFLLPFAPGDPVWAIKTDTLLMLKDLSENFFFIVPIANAAGIHLIKDPVLHPTAEALFNLVMGWTLLFGPLLFSDSRNNRFKGSLEALWLGQWLLTSTFLIPYMAIRLNNEASSSRPPSKLSVALVSKAKVIALVGAIVGVISIFWGLGGRSESGFGHITDRWSYFLDYVRTDRVAYAFVWDLCLYSLFQPWLIQSNLKKIKSREVQELVSILKFVPYVGTVAYLWGLSSEEELRMNLESNSANEDTA